jgi:hypothetical protein
MHVTVKKKDTAWRKKSFIFRPVGRKMRTVESTDVDQSKYLLKQT